MPGIAQRNVQFVNASLSSAGPVSVNGIWSKNRGGNLTFDQLQKFWSGLSPQARQELLRIDKQMLFEQARKNLYCSRCNGLLLEGFSQIVMYGRSLLQEGVGVQYPGKMGALRNQIENGLDIMPSTCQDDVQDPSVHPWGGLAATRDGMLTLLDCFLNGTSLMALQNVFDSARVRERERELLYPDACGGGGRGWISQGIANYGRGHGTRETCALHTARLSCDTLVDFWSALGDETRQSLLRMKEEDFIERLMYRFDSKRFCRDCRRNVIREFKELKELKRMRREPRCTNWFCVADTSFQYEVSKETVLADWHQSFTESDGTYHHFEWAIGTGEGKSDLLEFEDVGMNGSVEVNGLDLGGVTSCFITLRAWKLDGRCTELTVKAHALKGQACVHRRLIVGDGYVTITKGDNIRRFFEHAEEAEEEEDDDSIDKDGNELDGDGSRPQKHAKSPELAREFLLDAATVIFKEQVEKAFREGTARQNAHSIFVCLALKLLEERVQVACKEIITLEKQIKLLEEEEKEKREEEERRERRRSKEREKKLRRKERLKEREKDKSCAETNQLPIDSQASPTGSFLSTEEEPHNTSNSSDSTSVTEVIAKPSSSSSDIIDEQSSNESVNFKAQTLKDDNLWHSCNVDGEINARDGNGSFTLEQSKSSRRKLRFRKDSPLEQASRWCNRRRSIAGSEGGAYIDESESNLDAYKVTSSRCGNGLHRQSRNNTVKLNTRNCSLKFGEKFNSSNNRVRDRYDFHSCSCNMIKSGRDFKTASNVESALDRPFSRSSKYSHGHYAPDTYRIPKGKLVTGSTPLSRDAMNTKKVWEPMETRNKCPPRNNSDPDVTLRPSACKIDAGDGGSRDGNENGSRQAHNLLISFDGQCLSQLSGNSGQGESLNRLQSHMESTKTESNSFPVLQNAFVSPNNGSYPSASNSSSDNCSSCLSEGDSCTGSSGAHNAESLSTSDSEDTSFHSEGREVLTCSESTSNGFTDFCVEGKSSINGIDSPTSVPIDGLPSSSSLGHYSVDLPTKDTHSSDYGGIAFDVNSQRHHVLPVHNHSVHLPVFPAPSTMGYYHQNTASWGAAHANELLPFPHLNHYVYTGSLGYGLSTNQASHFCMQYGGLQPSMTPVLNVGRLPSYNRPANSNIATAEEQTKTPKLGGTKEATCIPAGIERPSSTTQLAQKGLSPEVNPSKSQNEDTFSLFHYGWPIAAAATRYSLNKDETIGDLPSKSSVAPVLGDLGCIKEDTTVEEYSLFAAKGGARFSIF
eukprot:TRINITY_DN6486_c0_g1_i4.p1 TRINITY_DN6486_c0_g1~~TRINITY_DN6486_c0_g1_i4.p1  ORF type:complete len:1259 (+),score=291.40 TRINITY_DN6486_c0_g1_i4:317-4093(+)